MEHDDILHVPYHYDRQDTAEESDQDTCTGGSRTTGALHALLPLPGSHFPGLGKRQHHIIIRRRFWKQPSTAGEGTCVYYRWKHQARDLGRCLGGPPRNNSSSLTNPFKANKADPGQRSKTNHCCDKHSIQVWDEYGETHWLLERNKYLTYIMGEGRAAVFGNRETPSSSHTVLQELKRKCDLVIPPWRLRRRFDGEALGGSGTRISSRRCYLRQSA